VSKDYYNDQDFLAFEIVSKELKFTSFSTPLLSFQITSKDLGYINKSKYLSFKLNDYDATVPVFQIVLDFMFETGGVF